MVYNLGNLLKGYLVSFCFLGVCNPSWCDIVTGMSALPRTRRSSGPSWVLRSVTPFLKFGEMFGAGSLHAVENYRESDYLIVGL